MASVSLRRLRKVYENGFVALHDVTLEIADGEFVVLVGPSGCGKSTTLRMVAGLEPITAGEVWIGERRVDELRAAERDIAMVFQNYALYPHMSVRENLAFALKLRRLPKPEIEQRIHQAAAMLGIDDVLDRRPRQLSGGQRQRVAVGRAIVRQPHVFLFDEPLSNLDAKLRVQTRKEISALHRRLDATMIYVTHDQIEAMTMGDRIVVLDRGLVQQVGTPLTLYERPANRFVAGFIGSPAMNFLEGELRVEDGSLWFRLDRGDAGLRLPDEVARRLRPSGGERVTLGIRPEDLQLANGPLVPRETATVEVRLEVRLEAAEPLGHETYLYVRLGKEELVCRIATQELPALGERACIAVDLRKLHFFQGADGVRLGLDGD